MSADQPSQDASSSIPPELVGLSFEDALERIETIVEGLESGDVPLADLLTRYEEASRLLKLCQRELDMAQLRIEKLGGKNGEISFEPVNPDLDVAENG